MSLRSKFIALLLIINSLLIFFSLTLYMNVSTSNKIKNEIAIIDSVNKALYEEILAVRGLFTIPLKLQVKTFNDVEVNLENALSELMNIEYLTDKSPVILESIKNIISARYKSLYFMPVMLDNADKILNEIDRNTHTTATIEVIRNYSEQQGNEQLKARVGMLTKALFGMEDNITASLATFEEQYRIIADERKRLEKSGILTFIIMFASLALISIIAGSLIIKSIIAVTYNLDKAHKETDAIFRNIHEGVFQLDQNLCIGNLCSRYFEELFHNIDFKKMPFTKFLGEIGIPGKDISITEDFLRLFFNEEININLLGQVNPLDRVSISLIDSSGHASEKYLTFSFSMFKNVNENMEILGTVKDITEEVLYAEALKDEEEKNREKMEQLFQVIHVEPTIMAEFFEDAQSEIDHINDLLKSNRTDYHEILQEIFLAVHSIKGNAQLLGMKNFANMLHKLEDDIKALLDKKEIKWESILDFAIKLGDIQEGINELKERIKDILQFQSSFKGLSEKAGLFERALQRVLFTEGAHVGKVINLECSNFNSKDIPDHHRKLVKDVFVQLARNAVNHGIEKPEDRKRKNKKPEGTISLSIRKGSDTDKGADIIEYSFRDDGGGINVELIARKAKERGLIKDGEPFSLSDAVKFVFTSGFSTADNTSLGAGRGIGLSIVKSRVSAAKGKIKVKTQKDKYCEYIITLPANAEEKSESEKQYA